MGVPQHLLQGPSGMVMDSTYEFGVARGGSRRWILVSDDALLDPAFDPRAVVAEADALELEYDREQERRTLDDNARSRPARAPRTPRRCAVYRFFDSEGRLLYVGKSINPANRMRTGHERRMWWPDVADQKVEWYDSEQAALDVEDRAIRDENPLYNRVTSVKR